MSMHNILIGVLIKSIFKYYCVIILFENIFILVYLQQGSI